MTDIQKELALIWLIGKGDTDPGGAAIAIKQVEAIITRVADEAVRQAQVKHAAEMSALDQEIMSLKAKLKGNDLKLKAQEAKVKVTSKSPK